MLGVLNSVVSIFYYFKVVRMMFFESGPGPGRVTLSPAAAGALWLAALMVIGIGLFPQPLMALLG